MEYATLVKTICCFAESAESSHYIKKMGKGLVRAKLTGILNDYRHSSEWPVLTQVRCLTDHTLRVIQGSV